jgi:outer membrane protein TolC
MKGILTGVAFVVLGLVPVGPAAGQAPAADTVSLAEAVDRALATSPLTARATADITAAEASQRSAFGALLPTLSVSLGSSLSPLQDFGAGATPVSGVNDSYDARLSASYDVFTGGRRGAERRQADASVSSAAANLEGQRFAVILSAQQAFFEVLRAADLIEVSTARVGRAEEALETATQRHALGSATRSDALRAQIELNSALEALLTAESQTEDAQFSLGRLVGASGSVTARVTPVEVVPLSLTTDEIIALAVAESPRVRTARAAVASAGAGSDVARAQQLPSVAMSAGYGWQNQQASLASGSTSWSLSLSLNYPIFDGFARDESLQRAEVQRTVASAELADAERTARTEAERGIRAVALAENRISLGEEAAAAAEEDLRVQRERYRLGASTILDLLASQTSLVEAQTNLIAARYDYQIARVTLESLLGRSL